MLLTDRIDTVLANEPLSYGDLARRLWPDQKAWRHASKGGPPGCYMALSAALRRGHFKVQMSHRDHANSSRMVYPRPPRPVKPAPPPCPIQRKRTPGWKMPPNTKYVGRPGKYGNPWYIGLWRGFTAQEAVDYYRRWIDGDLGLLSAGQPPSKDEIKRELRGFNLACFCRLDAPCHRTVLLEIANS